MEPQVRPLLGRDGELATVDAWLARVPSAVNAALLVITGEPGIGKTTLWGEATRRAGAIGYRVLSSRPVPSDAGLPHVVLGDLLRSVPDDALGPLPIPQRRALEVALLRADPGDGDLDPRAVGSGLTGLLDLMIADGPLVVAIDDAQWLDPASARALTFALRRLEHRPVAVIAAVRVAEAGQRGGEFAAIESSLSSTRIDIGPLSVAAIHQLFRQELGGAAVAGGHTPRGRRQPVLRARDRQGSAAGRCSIAWPAAAGACRPSRAGNAAVAPAPSGDP